MKLQRLCKVLAFAATGGVLLQTTGCDTTSLLTSLASTLVPLALQLLLSGIGT
jgi:hypothetical protein